MRWVSFAATFSFFNPGFRKLFQRGDEFDQCLFIQFSSYQEGGQAFYYLIRNESSFFAPFSFYQRSDPLPVASCIAWLRS